MPDHIATAIRRAASKHDRAVAAADTARDGLIAAVRDAHAAGVGERTIADVAGVQRSTIRRWIGKDDRP